jgi:hypothetical protein
MTSSSAQAKQEVCLARFSSIRHTSARSVSPIKGFGQIRMISRGETTVGAQTHMCKIFTPHFCKFITNVAMSLITGS